MEQPILERNVRSTQQVGNEKLLKMLPLHLELFSNVFSIIFKNRISTNTWVRTTRVPNCNAKTINTYFRHLHHQLQDSKTFRWLLVVNIFYEQQYLVLLGHQDLVHNECTAYWQEMNSDWLAHLLMTSLFNKVMSFSSDS